MKILLVSTQIVPVPPRSYGGLEVVVYDLAEELGRAGHDVYVLAPDGSSGEHFNVIMPCAPHVGNPEADAYEAIKPALRDFDIIHDHSWQGHVYLSKREAPELKILHTLHGYEPYRVNPVERPCWVTPSHHHSRHIREHLGSEVEVVYHGIDLEKHALETTKGDYLLYMARVTPFKGALEFVDLCVKVGMKGLLAGEDIYVEDSIGYVRQVTEACEASGGLVRYLGRATQEWKVELMQGAAALISPLKPPYYEIFGLTTIEAMACGTPVLSTDRGAARELIRPGVSGAIAEDVDCLASHLQIAMQCSPEACREAAEEFSRAKMAETYVGLYEKILAGEEW